MVRIPTNREPTHPGEMLLEEFLNPMGITQRELAEKIILLFEHTELRNSIGENGMQLIAEKININTMINGFAKALNIQ